MKTETVKRWGYHSNVFVQIFNQNDLRFIALTVNDIWGVWPESPSLRKLPEKSASNIHDF